MQTTRSDRDRFIDLIANADTYDRYDCELCTKDDNACRNCYAERLADYLLSNGAIVPTCKVGDTVYIPWCWDGQQGVGFAEVEEIRIYDNKNHIMFFLDLESDDEEFEQQYGGWKLDKSIGDTVFLTKEEAEAKLKEREGK